MATVTLDDLIGQVSKELLEIFKRDYREILDQNITLLDLSYEALKVNVYRNTKQHIEAYDNAYEALKKVLNKEAKRKYSSLEQVPVGYFQKKNFSYVYIDGGDTNRFIVANSFGALDTVVRKISRDPELVRTSFGTNTIFKTVLNRQGKPSGDVIKSFRRKSDIGHIATEDEDALTSPLELKISDVLKFGESSNNAAIIAAAKKALNELYNIQVGAQYSFKNVAPDAISTTQKVLGRGYVVVTLHREKLNNKFSQEEAKIFFNLKNTIAKILQNKPFESVSGSNTIIQDIEETILNILDPKKRVKRLKSHNKQTKTPKRLNINANTSAKAEKVSVKKQNIRPEVYTVPSYSLINLQSIINQMLYQTIKSNMGDGSRKDVLNYRTGRFAKSVKVERLSKSKADMITAFYSYMKNPYATFSQGGKQEYPKSRDPKLLISKSIRDIVSKQVASRLRAVAL